MKNILITGANGLIARIVAIQLNHAGYSLFGVDIDPEGTPSSRFKRENHTGSGLLQICSYKTYYQVDITAKYEFTQIINKIGKIDCVIHLAALSDNESVENIKKVNEGGTETLFAICQEQKIDNIILASSVMTVWGKLVDEKIYLQDTVKINSTAIHLPKNISPPLLAYINSKISMERIALRYYNSYQISSVSMRIGAVSCDNFTYQEPGINTIWCSHDDIAAFTQSAVATLTNKQLPFFGVYYVCSINNKCWVELAPAKKDLGFEPVDSADHPKMSSELQQQIKIFGQSKLKRLPDNELESNTPRSSLIKSPR